MDEQTAQSPGGNSPATGQNTRQSPEQSPSQPLPPETPTSVSTTSAPTPPPPTQTPKKAFSTLLKIILVLVVVGLLAGGGYYFGVLRNQPKPTPTPAPEKMTASISPTTEPLASPSTAATKTVTGGLSGPTSAFKMYSIEIPSGWTDTKDVTAASDKLTITKDGYSLSIYQAAFGGGGCIYKGDAPQQLAQTFTDFAEITGQGTQMFRRSWNTPASGATIPYALCQKADDGSYSSLTGFGKIDATSPNPADPKILEELDSMVASIKQQ